LTIYNVQNIVYKYPQYRSNIHKQEWIKRIERTCKCLWNADKSVM